MILLSGKPGEREMNLAASGLEESLAGIAKKNLADGELWMDFGCAVTLEGVAGKSPSREEAREAFGSGGSSGVMAEEDVVMA